LACQSWQAPIGARLLPILSALLRKPTATEITLETAGFVLATAKDPGALAPRDLAAKAQRQASHIRRALLRSGMVMEPTTRRFLTDAHRGLTQLGKKPRPDDLARLTASLEADAKAVITAHHTPPDTPEPRLRHQPKADGMDELYYRYLLYKPDANTMAAEVTSLVLGDATTLPNPGGMPDSLIAGEYARKINHALKDTGEVMDRDTRHLLIKAHNVFVRLEGKPSRMVAAISAGAPPGLQLPRKPDPRWQIEFRQSLNELIPDATKVRDRMIREVTRLDEMSSGSNRSPAPAPTPATSPARGL